jgi:hypothetical protein
LPAHEFRFPAGFSDFPKDRESDTGRLLSPERRLLVGMREAFFGDCLAACWLRASPE